MNHAMNPRPHKLMPHRPWRLLALGCLVTAGLTAWANEEIPKPGALKAKADAQKAAMQAQAETEVAKASAPGAKGAKPKAEEHGHGAPAKADAHGAKPSSQIAEQLREAVQANNKGGSKSIQVVSGGNERRVEPVPASHGKPAGYTRSTAAPIERLEDKPAGAHGAPAAHGAAPVNRQQYIRARAAALAGHDAPKGGHGGEVHWAYEGEAGPQAWGQLKPEFNVCAIGKRQSPIHIEEASTLRGPAEPLQINYRMSNASVVNNGHTIQVDVDGDNTLMVRGSSYKLVQFHFHHPSEEKINYKGYAMVAHLVHKNAEGQLAVLAVLMDPGASNPLVDKVWTHMPLDVSDRVRMPNGLLDLKELLPEDRRYYQFIGSLTTPPCTEGVLWLVLKQPMTLSREQLKLFAQLFPNNARPVQALNNRVVREAQ